MRVFLQDFEFCTRERLEIPLQIYVRNRCGRLDFLYEQCKQSMQCRMNEGNFTNLVCQKLAFNQVLEEE